MEHGGDIYTNQNIELDFSVNLSPLGPPESVTAALAEMLAAEDPVQKGRILSWYPDPLCRELREALEKKTGLPREWITCGNGASELIMALVQAARPRKAMVPAPTYQGYERCLRAAGAEIVRHRLHRENGFALTGDILTDLRKDRDISMLFLCSPNNPAGNCIEPALLGNIAEYCRENRILLAADECYLDLLPGAGERSLKGALAENPYLVIINAFTKTYAMPGLRIGYLLSSNEKLQKKLRLQQPEWSVSMIAQRAAIAALRDTEYLGKAVQMVRAERAYVCERLRRLGAEVVEGEAPFVLFRVETELYEPLREQGILIRRCGGIPGLEGPGHFYRTGLRSHEENRLLMDRIERILLNTPPDFSVS